MILLLLSSIFIIPALMGLGKVVESFLGSLYTGISGNIISGIVGISLIWSVLAFFLPLNIYIEIPTLLIGFFYFFKEKLFLKWYHFSKQESALALSIILIIAFCSSYYPYILDHFGYYVPTIQWLTEYGMVKGMSNLDLTLGQMSIWHIFQAGFSNFSDPFLRMNAVILIIYTIYIIEKKSWAQLCFLPVLLLFSQSPSPDLPVVVFSLILLNEIVSGNRKTDLLFGFSIFVFAIKPTMIWIPILSFLYSILIVKSNFKSLLFGGAVLLLFFVKNIWTFGYPIFPISIIDLGISWKPNPEILQKSSQYAILKTYDMQYSYQEIQNFSWWEYAKNWLFLNGIKSKINILFILSLLVFTIFAFFKKNKMVTLILISILIKSILVLLFSAQYRFFIDVFFVIFFVLFFKQINKTTSIAAFSGLSIVLIIFLTFPTLLQQYLPSFRLGSFMGPFEKKQLYSPSVYHYKSFDSFKTGNLKFNVSKNYPYNFDTPIPAISRSYIIDDIHAGIFPQYIDEKNVKKGFIWKKLNSKQIKDTQNIIYSIKNTH
ncbi:membrane protein [Chryseobacterium soli]|uniref:Membrane protein n=1 Tax=Chryseobacterium soli TaxID=445961 RepID=A0A086A0L1_9FLAO|nr:hypothetical protein [Chryseobacterium soli]KFF10225.1 membrane protein [Chryseobacterium soli]